MTKAAVKLCVFITLFVLSLWENPALAHVKWFLGGSEQEILAMPKPALFTHLSLANIVPTILALVVLYASIAIGLRYSSSKMHTWLLGMSKKWEPAVNLILGVCVGTLLIQCANDYSLFAPNMCACEEFPDWVVSGEAVLGWCLALGFCSQLSAIGLFALLCATFTKFPAADCLDLIPIYGIAIYLFLNGRDKYSLDSLLLIALKKANSKRLADQRSSRAVANKLRKQGALDLKTEMMKLLSAMADFSSKYKQTNVDWSHILLRAFLGLGLMILGLDEKLLHPQLALHILEKMPALNIISWAHFGNDMFVLCAGLTEVVVGLILIVGSLPRLSVLFLFALFIGTTIVFGSKELYGHMPYYGMIVAVALRGNGVYDAMKLPVLVPIRKIVTAVRQGSQEMLSQLTT